MYSIVGKCTVIFVKLLLQLLMKPLAEYIKDLNCLKNVRLWIKDPVLGKNQYSLNPNHFSMSRLFPCRPEFVAKGLIELINDDTKNGEAMVVSVERGIAYHQFTTKGV
jgi:hypothetical protein